MSSWDLYHIVLVVYRERNISQAAKVLDVSQATIRRHIKCVESDLGTKLFDRVNNELCPTFAGSTFLRRAERVEKEIQAIRDELSGASSKLAGDVRVTAIESLLGYMMLPYLDKFRNTYPDISLELLGSERNYSFQNNETDIALRLTRPEGLDVVKEKLGDINYSVYGSKEKYFDSSIDFNQENWIGSQKSISHIPEVQWQHKNLTNPNIVLRTNNPVVMSESVCGGVGLCIFPHYWGDSVKGIIRLSGEEPIFQRELWMLVESKIFQHAKIKATCKWLREITSSLRVE